MPAANKMMREIQRPMPNEAAKRGLLKVKFLEAEFSDGVTKKEQQAALDHLTDLITFWNLRYRVWKT